MNSYVVNFTLNKFLPFLVISFLCFLKMGFDTYEPYIVIIMSFFIGHFHFKTGYAVAYCEKNNINLNTND